MTRRIPLPAAVVALCCFYLAAWPSSASDEAQQGASVLPMLVQNDATIDEATPARPAPNETTKEDADAGDSADDVSTQRESTEDNASDESSQERTDEDESAADGAGSDQASEDSMEMEETSDDGEAQVETSEDDGMQGDAAVDEPAEDDAVGGDDTSDAMQEEMAEDEAAEEEDETPPLEDRGYALDDVTLGDADAPLTVYEYVSFTCGHCATFHANTYPQFKEQYIDTGKVNYVVRDVYFDQIGLLAGRLVRCGGDAGYYLLADAVLKSQSEWIRDDNPAVALYEVALKLGFPATRLRSCVEDREFAEHLVESFKVNIERDEVESTPTFLIGDERVVGAKSFEEFAETLDEALGG